MLDVSTSSKLARFARWGLIGVVVLMGAALVATVWSTNRAVSDASDTVVRGQAEVFRASAFSLRRPGVELTPEVLEDVLDQHVDDGLRYLAMYDRSGALLAAAGEPSLAPLDLAERELVRVDDRVRVSFGPPVKRRRRGRHASRPATLVIEFEPRVANQLSSSADTGLAIGGLAGLGLIVFAVVLVRWYQRAEERERTLAHERRLASLGQMSAVLAHEIRNPIASLKGNAQLLVKMLPDEGKPRTKAERLVDESVRLETLTNDLLEFARAGEIERAPTSPADLLRDAAGAVDRERIHIDAAGAPGSWALDRDRIRQVLTNLLDNACQASDQPVDARIGQSQGQLEFVIRDRGDGIPAADLERIFEPFYTKKSRGTGLGLAVAQRMVELHGGMIRAHNHPDGGAVFTVSIPA